MARPLRIQFAGAVYHVISRGVARQRIYVDDEDHRAFLSILNRTGRRLRWRIWTYCLMPNHYHLLVETPEPNLARGMHDVNGTYSTTFNNRHDRIGHLFHGRYKALLVDKDRYLLALSRYIVLNPVRAGLAAGPEHWRWSSYRALLGAPDSQMSLVETFRILHLFGSSPDVARANYRKFVRAGMNAPHVPEPAPNRSILGDECFVHTAVRHFPEPDVEVSRADRVMRTLQDYERSAASRDEAIRAAYAGGAYSLRQIGDYFRLHYSTVSRIVKASVRQFKI
jgi:REP-associated tyrosine transposase